MPLPHPSEHLCPEDRSEQQGIKQLLLQHFDTMSFTKMDQIGRHVYDSQGYLGQL